MADGDVPAQQEPIIVGDPSAKPRVARYRKGPPTNHDLLRVVEDLLAAVFALPGWPPAEALNTEAKRTKYFGLGFDEATAKAEEYIHDLVGLCWELNPKYRVPGEMQQDMILSLTGWAGRSRHESRRREAIALLLELREGLIQRLQVIPPPGGPQLPPLRWGDLRLREKRIVLIVHAASEPQVGKQIAAQLGIPLDHIGRELADLAREGILRKNGRLGYQIAELPAGFTKDLDKGEGRSKR